MGQSTPELAVEKPDFALVQDKLVACSAVVGEAFFPKMVEALAEVLSVRWIFLCTLHPSIANRACTVVVWNDGPAENFEYDLEFTPCANIVAQGACAYPNNITRLFPQDTMLIEMGAESYVGTALRSSSGQVLGLIAALDDKPIDNPERAKEILGLFSGRAAAELERLSTASLNERLGRIVEDSVSEVYVFNAETYLFELVNRGARENLGYSMAEMRGLTPWDLKPEYSREQFIDVVAPLKRGEVADLLFETKHQRKNGSLYDVSVRLQFVPGVEDVFYASINDITVRKQAEAARAHLAAIVASSNEAIISMTLDAKVTSWNAGAEQIYGYSAAEMVGHSIRRVIPDDRRDEEDMILARIGRGEQIKNYETVRVHRDGRQIDVTVSVSPIFDAAGKIIGASKIAHDIGERKRADARERLLMGEVNHRAKNLLALVQVIARQTAASDTATFVERFDERIHALAASHDVLVQSRWKDVPLQELVRSQLGHFSGALGSRIKMSGPDLEIKAAAAQAIAMALHELATNAAKYGGLSNDSGVVDIFWKLATSEASEPVFELNWIENGGPPVFAPTRRGFGSTVIERILKFSVNGDVTHDFDPAGLVFQIRCPAAQVLESADVVVTNSAAPDFSANRHPKRAHNILLVEDEILIGIDMCEMLKGAGFQIVGPVGTVTQALELLDTEICDAAVLDINLGGGATSEAVAERLSAMGLPYLTVSSYGVDQRPKAYCGSPHLDKPLRPELLIGGLGRLINTADMRA